MLRSNLGHSYSSIPKLNRKEFENFRIPQKNDITNEFDDAKIKNSIETYIMKLLAFLNKIHKVLIKLRAH